MRSPWSTPRTPHRGKVKVYIDGVYDAHDQPQDGDVEQSPGRLARWYFPSGGTHTITLKVVGTGTYPLVRLDAFVVSR